MIHNLKHKKGEFFFTYKNNFGAVDVRVGIDNKAFLFNYILFNKPLDRTDSVHVKAARVIANEVCIVCNNNEWVMWDY